MIWLVIGCACALVLAGFAAFLRWDDRRDDRRARHAGFPQPDHPGTAGLGTMPPEIAHELAPFPGPRNPPARAGAHPFAGDARPGTAAAAVDHSPQSPPPLLTSPARPAVLILSAIIGDLTAHLDAAWEREVLAVFPPDRPWPGDDDLLAAIEGGA